MAGSSSTKCAKKRLSGTTKTGTPRRRCPSGTVRDRRSACDKYKTARCRRKSSGKPRAAKRKSSGKPRAAKRKSSGGRRASYEELKKRAAKARAAKAAKKALAEKSQGVPDVLAAAKPSKPGKAAKPGKAEPNISENCISEINALVNEYDVFECIDVVACKNADGRVNFNAIVDISDEDNAKTKRKLHAENRKTFPECADIFQKYKNLQKYADEEKYMVVQCDRFLRCRYDNGRVAGYFAFTRIGTLSPVTLHMLYTAGFVPSMALRQIESAEQFAAPAAPAAAAASAAIPENVAAAAAAVGADPEIARRAAEILRNAGAGPA